MILQFLLTLGEKMTEKILVPDIGDYKSVPVIEILVKVGDKVEKEQSLITLESDKSTMEVPSPQAGVVQKINLKIGEKVSQGSLILELQTIQDNPASVKPTAVSVPTPIPVQTNSPNGNSQNANYDCEVLVIGAGPGGYTAAFRCADLGLKTVLVEKHQALGGVCLNVGCIPSKALLHVAGVINEAKEISSHGVEFASPKIDINKIRSWKESVIGKLTKGLLGLAKQRKVMVITGEAKFASPSSVEINVDGKTQSLSFKHAIIAVGSQSVKIPSFPEDDRIFTSTGALRLDDIPKTMLVIGGGIIGLEMATVYATLGTKVTIVELLPGIMTGADRDLVRPMQKKLQKIGKEIEIKTATKVTNIKAEKKGLIVSFEKADGGEKLDSATFDKVLLSVGRRSNGKLIAVEKAGVNIDDRGFINVDKQMRTNVPHIFAIGDVVGEPMLAHKATHQGKVAAEVISGLKSAFDPISIPAVAYTDPEVAWVGLTEIEAQNKNIPFEKAVFPWAASGRALSMAREEGATKLIYDPQTHRVIGGGIVGKNAGELIGEICLAVEMGSDINDLALTIHPHPTLCETVGFSAEIAEGSITDLYIPKNK